MNQKYYQRAGNEALYIANEEDGKIAVSSQDAGYVQYLTHDEFAKIFKEVKPDLSQKKGTVTAAFLREGAVVPCYSNVLGWNGWGMPRFDRAGVDQVIPAIDLGVEIEYRFEGDVLYMQNPEYNPDYPEDPESSENLKTFKIEPISAVIDGVPTLLWPIGQGWTWDSVQFTDAGR